MNRKTKITLAACLFFAAAHAHAGYGKGNHVVSASLGGVIAAGELGEVKGIGPGAGAAYRYYFSDVFSLGADTAYDNYGDHFSEEDQTDVDISLFSTSLVGRLDFFPREEWASYLSVGFGSYYLEQEFHEAQGNNTETTARSGYFLALGFEAPLARRWMWGAELRSIDPLGVSANAVGLKFNLSRRFGKEMTKPEVSFD